MSDVVFAGLARTVRWAVCVGLCALWVVPGQAHMFYLEPRLLNQAAGADSARLLVDVKVGHPFDAEVLPRMGHHVDEFVLIDETGNAEPVSGVDGRAPAGVATWSGEPRLLAYRSHAVAHRMKRAAFLRYGEEEGLSHLMAAQPAATSGLESESYHRCAKALVGVPLGSSEGQGLASRAVDCSLDLVAAESTGTFQVLFRGEAMPFVLVRLSAADGREETVRSDAEGRVQLDLTPGAWIASAVHLEPIGIGEWQSWWASFVFEVDGSPSQTSTTAARGTEAG